MREEERGGSEGWRKGGKGEKENNFSMQYCIY